MPPHRCRSWVSSDIFLVATLKILSKKKQVKLRSKIYLMVNKHKKRYSTYCEGNTNRNHQLAPTRMATFRKKRKKTEHSSAGEDVGEREPHACWWDRKLVWPLWTTVWRVLRKLRRELPHGPEAPLLGVSLKRMKPPSWRGICTPVFTVALFTTVETWIWPKCLCEVNG